MNIAFRQLSLQDGMDIYNMLQEIPVDENGFMNGCHGKTPEEYQHWLAKSDRIAQGIGLEDWQVPQTVYWLYVDGIPVGMAKLRHRLTDKLREDGGNAGYAIRPSQCGKGLGKLQLQLLIEKARELGIDKLLLTVQNHNVASLKVALANGGRIEKVSDVRHYIWIDC